jgi:hypothetical protein
MDDDQWRADGSFRGLSGGSGGGKGRGGGKGGGGNMQFTRVIPKFLRAFQQPPEIQAKFAPPPPGDDDADDHELDEVQRAAIDEYLAKQEAKKLKTKADGEQKQAEEGKEEPEKGEEEAADAGHKEVRQKKVMQSVAALGKAGRDATKGKKRKRSGDAPARLDNKKLLSFSMDDEE